MGRQGTQRTGASGGACRGWGEVYRRDKAARRTIKPALVVGAWYEWGINQGLSNASGLPKNNNRRAAIPPANQKVQSELPGPGRTTILLQFNQDD